MTANAKAIKRPMFPANTTKNKTIIKNVKITHIDIKHNTVLLSTSICNAISEYNDIINACAIANVDSFNSLPENQAAPDGGSISGSQNGTTNDIANAPTNNARVIIYGAFASR